MSRPPQSTKAQTWKQHFANFERSEPTVAQFSQSIGCSSAITQLLRGSARPEELLPDRWKANHPEAVRTYREQERRDKADTATLSAAKLRARQQLRMLT